MQQRQEIEFKEFKVLLQNKKNRNNLKKLKTLYKFYFIHGRSIKLKGMNSNQ